MRLQLDGRRGRSRVSSDEPRNRCRRVEYGCGCGGGDDGLNALGGGLRAAHSRSELSDEPDGFPVVFVSAEEEEEQKRKSACKTAFFFFSEVCIYHRGDTGDRREGGRERGGARVQLRDATRLRRGPCLSCAVVVQTEGGLKAEERGGGGGE